MPELRLLSVAVSGKPILQPEPSWITLPKPRNELLIRMINAYLGLGFGIEDASVRGTPPYLLRAGSMTEMPLADSCLLDSVLRDRKQIVFPAPSQTAWPQDRYS